MREIKISIETAQRWANGTDEELKGLALQTYPELAKKQLPKSWEELEKIQGFYVTTCSEIMETAKVSGTYKYKNTFATKEQAEASIALAQLSQLELACEENYEYMRKTFPDLIKKILVFKKLIVELY